MRVLWVSPTLDDVRRARYAIATRSATRREVLESAVPADALLAYAQSVADETDDAIKAGRDKTRTLITLTGFFLTALAFIVRGGSRPAFWTSVAFGGVAVAALLLHRSLRVTWHNRLVLTASDLSDTDEAAFKRSHAADLLFNAHQNDGVVAFIVDTHRAAMRALLIALVATLTAALWPPGGTTAINSLPPSAADTVREELSPPEDGVATDQATDGREDTVDREQATLKSASVARPRTADPLDSEPADPDSDRAASEPSLPPRPDTTEGGRDPTH